MTINEGSFEDYHLYWGSQFFGNPYIGDSLRQGGGRLENPKAQQQTLRNLVVVSFSITLNTPIEHLCVCGGWKNPSGGALTLNPKPVGKAQPAAEAGLPSWMRRDLAIRRGPLKAIRCWRFWFGDFRGLGSRVLRLRVSRFGFQGFRRLKVYG